MAAGQSKKTRVEIPERHFDKEGRFCVFEIYHKSKRVIYYFQGDQAKHLSKVTLDGYDGLPSGLYLNRNGYGFGKKGTFLLSALSTYISSGKKLDLIISSKNMKSVRIGSLVTVVTLPYQDIKNLLFRLGRINEDSNNELRETVASFLNTKFPKRVRISTADFDEYKGGEIAAVLRRKKVADKLNEEDLQSLKDFFPRIFETSLKGKKKTVRAERDALIRNTKSITDRIFLDEVIREFEQNLSKRSLDENTWQVFLRDKVFRFLANYITSIEKQNVSLDVSYPDFVLVDVYGFVDVFEIKRHDTPLLAFDDDHENYYWKPDVAKAISQIENYIDKIIHTSDDYIRTIRRKKRLDIKVIRPRGYIIAGTSKQFSGEKEIEDFRKLGIALKNTTFILYDELLENLRNLRSKL
jgi:Domain of unknown function (DUF4263)